MSQDTLSDPVPLHVVSKVVETIWTDHVHHVEEHHCAPQFWQALTDRGPAAVIDWPDGPEGWALKDFGRDRIDLAGFWEFRNLPAGRVYAEVLTSATLMLFVGA